MSKPCEKLRGHGLNGGAHHLIADPMHRDDHLRYLRHDFSGEDSRQENTEDFAAAAQFGRALHKNSEVMLRQKQ